MTTMSRRPQAAASSPTTRAAPLQPSKSRETQGLERRYGEIGISAVAAASCLKDRASAERKLQAAAILARFEEHD